MTEPVRINKHLAIPLDEISFTYTTSGGPGGQHANKVATRVGLMWNVAESRVLGPRQRARIMAALKSRIDSSGTLRLSSDRRRSQLRNKEDVLGRLETLVQDALRPSKNRIATSPSTAARERRLQDKRRRSQAKSRRRAPTPDD
jgi:ribosome-associated protein